MKTLYTGIVCNNPDYVHTPLIAIQPLDNYDDIANVLSSKFDYVLFTSRFAVKFAAKYINNFDDKIVVSIGKTTTTALNNCGIFDVKQVEQDDSYGVIEWFSKQKVGSVLIPRSNLALVIIPSGLLKLGFSVTPVVVYQNIMPQNPSVVNLDEFDKIIFTSPSTIDNFVKLYGCLPLNIEFVTRGRITEEHLKKVISNQCKD